MEDLRAENERLRNEIRGLNGQIEGLHRSMAGQRKRIDEAFRLAGRIRGALDVAARYGTIDGAHHRAWVVDQIVRALCDNYDQYKAWVADQPEWTTGTAP